MTNSEHYIGLTQLCEALNSELGYSFTINEVVYFIRHVSVAIGCKNACSHCFSNSPLSVSQTSLSGFKIIINEIGEIVTRNNKGLSFFHLGAANDPAYIKDYYKYLLEWRDAIPNFQLIKVFTHGWNLFDTSQQIEFNKFLEVIQKYDTIKVVISFDSFSNFARKDWDKYIYNISQNLREIVSCIGCDRIRVEVFYSPERITCNPELTLDFYRNLLINGCNLTIEDIITKIECAGLNDVCSKITLGVLNVFKYCNLDAPKLISMTRDCESIFPAGRGEQYFKTASEDIRNKGLEIQENKVLYSLKDYCHKYNGVIINPDGTCQMVDYHGYKVGRILNDGKPIIPYMSLINK